MVGGCMGDWLQLGARWVMGGDVDQPASVMSVPVLVISNDKLDTSNEKQAP